MCIALSSREFDVKNGGLKVTFDADWNAKSGAACDPKEKYIVKLKRSGIFSDTTITTTTMPPGRFSLSWTGLPNDTYYLEIRAAGGHSESCCLQGDLLLFFFNAPPPAPRRRFRPGDIA